MPRLSPHTAPRAVLLATMLCVPLGACDSGSSSSSDAATAADGPAGLGGSGGGGLGGFSGTGGTKPTGGSGGTPTGNPDGGRANPDAADPNQIPIGMPDPAVVKECSDLQVAQCAKISQCFPQIFKERYGDMATCMTKAPMGCNSQPSIPGTAVTAPMLAACLTARAAQTCDALLSNVTPPECDYKGTRGLGSACTDARQCTTGYCSFSGDICGVCANSAQAGAPCQGSYQCASGLICAPGINLCVTLAKVGEPCGARAFCGYGLFCSPAGTCAAELAMGAACDPMVGSCSVAGDLECDPATMKCVPHIYGAKGASCDARVNDCYPGGACLSSAAMPNAGVCMDLPKQGEQCDPQQLPCQEPWNCLQASATTYVCDFGVYVDPNICKP
jgi:hypothetical protein